jgi:hypothetical protein
MPLFTNNIDAISFEKSDVDATNLHIHVHLLSKEKP